MNHNSLKYLHPVSLNYLNPAASAVRPTRLPGGKLFARIGIELVRLVSRLRTDESRLHFRLKREQAEKTNPPRDVIGSLPVDEKLRLGMYRFMD